MAHTNTYNPIPQIEVIEEHADETPKKKVNVTKS